jgi:hypothetical protein
VPAPPLGARGNMPAATRARSDVAWIRRLRSVATRGAPASDHLRRPRAPVQHSSQNCHPPHDHVQIALAGPRDVEGLVAVAAHAAATSLRVAALAGHPLVATLVRDGKLKNGDIVRSSIVVGSQATRRVHEAVSTVACAVSAGDASRRSEHAEGVHDAPLSRPPGAVGRLDAVAVARPRTLQDVRWRGGSSSTSTCTMTQQTAVMVVVIEAPAAGTSMGPPVRPLPRVGLVPILDVRNPDGALLPVERPADLVVPVVTQMAAWQLPEAARMVHAMRHVEFITLTSLPPPPARQTLSRASPSHGVCLSPSPCLSWPSSQPSSSPSPSFFANRPR